MGRPGFHCLTDFQEPRWLLGQLLEEILIKREFSALKTTWLIDRGCTATPRNCQFAISSKLGAPYRRRIGGTNKSSCLALFGTA